MRLTIALLTMSLAAEPAWPQALAVPARPRGEPPSESAVALKDAKESSDCESRWDAATHMTKKQWSQTCRRVLERTHVRVIEVVASAEDIQ